MASSGSSMRLDGYQSEQLAWLKSRVKQFCEKMEGKYSEAEINALIDDAYSLVVAGVRRFHDVNVPDTLGFLETFKALTPSNLMILLNHPLAIGDVGLALRILERNTCDLVSEPQSMTWQKIPKNTELRVDISKLLNTHMESFCKNVRTLSSRLLAMETVNERGGALYSFVVSTVSSPVVAPLQNSAAAGSPSSAAEHKTPAASLPSAAGMFAHSGAGVPVPSPAPAAQPQGIARKNTGHGSGSSG